MITWPSMVTSKHFMGLLKKLTQKNYLVYYLTPLFGKFTAIPFEKIIVL